MAKTVAVVSRLAREFDHLERRVAVRTSALCPACIAGIDKADRTWGTFKLCDECANKTMTIEQAEAEALRLERDAAISLLLEAPRVCERGAVCSAEHLASCWACRVDKFLRDAGVRR